MTTLVEHRRDLDGLLNLALSDLAGSWRGVTSADAALEALTALLPRLVSVYGSAAATLGADWYDEFRAAAKVPGAFRAIPAELPDLGRTDALAGWAVGPLFSATPDFDAAKTRAAGGFQRIVLNANRMTVAGSSIADPAADGWQRLGQGGNCAFCTMLISRGAVYRDSTADFASHDHCNCYAAPAFRGQPRHVMPYRPSTRAASEADRARVREYLRTH